jgi:dTMP kinase
MNVQRKGCFIVFEGLDGSGKSTQVRELSSKLQKMKYEVISTKEPTNKSVIGSLIERILYNHTVVPDEVLALLFAADRANHTINTIIPALEKGSIVISDRYVYSSLAYQSRGMKKRLEIDWIRSINQAAIEPDLVIFLDVSPKEAVLRLQKGQKRVQDHNFFENLEVQTRIRDAYYDVFNFHQLDTNIQNIDILRIDAKLPVKQIREIIGERVSKLLKKKKIERKNNKKKNNGNLNAFFSVSESSETSEKKKEKTELNVFQMAQDSDNY